CGRLFAIDDLADRRHDCDLLLDQNLGRQPADYAGLVPAPARILAGPSFSLLRPEFAQLREASAARRRSAPWRRILLAMGGVDLHNMTGRMLSALGSCALPAGCEVTVVMGATAPWLDEVRAVARQVPYPAHVIVNVPDMARHLADADIAIGAAGSSAWERCCLGVPTVLAIVADNQRPGAMALAAAGAALLLPEDAGLEEALASSLSSLGADGLLRRMQDVCLAITDGLGTERVAQEMLDACARRGSAQ
ncbi:MAG TPA: UDP-2,4-diacetamido-2,4,6-trideoxy-beta-L-altropyranose hydrolase, partial [Ramlibacter sp.]